VRRGGLRTLLAAGATLAAVIAGAFALQAFALGRPNPTRLIIAAVVGKLNAFHEARTRIVLAGERERSICLQNWHNHVRTAQVWFDNGSMLRDVIGVKTHFPSKRAMDEFILAGCPRPLSEWITRQLGRGEPIVFRDVRVGATHVYLVRFRGAQLGLRLYISPKLSLPIRLALQGDGLVGASWPIYGTPLPSRSWWAV
jgi:hypothetical protein